MLLIAACLTAVIIIRKIPQLSLIDLEAIVKPKEKAVEERILRERLQRKVADVRKKVRTAEKFFGTLVLRITELWARLREVERWLRTLRGGAPAPTVETLLSEAEAHVESDPKQAERAYLEVIKRDPQNTLAYRGLAELFIAGKQWLEAKEMLKFLGKLDNENVDRYAFRLAEIAREEGRSEDAMRLAWEAVEKGGKEPRYLDFFIEMSILCKHRRNAERGLLLLKEVNPENAKIPEFEERILAL